MKPWLFVVAAILLLIIDSQATSNSSTPSDAEQLLWPTAKNLHDDLTSSKVLLNDSKAVFSSKVKSVESAVSSSKCLNESKVNSSVIVQPTVVNNIYIQILLQNATVPLTPLKVVGKSNNSVAENVLNALQLQHSFSNYSKDQDGRGSASNDHTDKNIPENSMEHNIGLNSTEVNKLHSDSIVKIKSVIQNIDATKNSENSKKLGEISEGINKNLDTAVPIICNLTNLLTSSLAETKKTNTPNDSTKSENHSLASEAVENGTGKSAPERPSESLSQQKMSLTTTTIAPMFVIDEKNSFTARQTDTNDAAVTSASDSKKNGEITGDELEKVVFEGFSKTELNYAASTNGYDTNNTSVETTAPSTESTKKKHKQQQSSSFGAITNDNSRINSTTINSAKHPDYVPNTNISVETSSINPENPSANAKHELLNETTTEQNELSAVKLYEKVENETTINPVTLPAVDAKSSDVHESKFTSVESEATTYFASTTITTTTTTTIDNESETARSSRFSVTEDVTSSSPKSAPSSELNSEAQLVTVNDDNISTTSSIQQLAEHTSTNEMPIQNEQVTITTVIPESTEFHTTSENDFDHSTFYTSTNSFTTSTLDEDTETEEYSGSDIDVTPGTASSQTVLAVFSTDGDNDELLTNVKEMSVNEVVTTTGKPWIVEESNATEYISGTSATTEISSVISSTLNLHIDTNEMTATDSPTTGTSTSSLVASTQQNRSDAILSLNNNQKQVNRPDEVKVKHGHCPVPNDPENILKADIIFYINTPNINRELKFIDALHLIMNTVSEFNNIGFGGIQVSLAQYDNNPIIEFPLSKHDCKPYLLADIADTIQANQTTKLKSAVQDIVDVGFTPQMGDRENVPNILILISDGTSDSQVQQPIKFTKHGNTTILVIAAVEFHPDAVKELVKNALNDCMNLSSSFSNSLSARLAQRIKEVSSITDSNGKAYSEIDAENEFEKALKAGKVIARTVNDTESGMLDVSYSGGVTSNGSSQITTQQLHSTSDVTEAILREETTYEKQGKVITKVLDTNNSKNHEKNMPENENWQSNLAVFLDAVPSGKSLNKSTVEDLKSSNNSAKAEFNKTDKILEGKDDLSSTLEVDTTDVAPTESASNSSDAVESTTKSIDTMTDEIEKSTVGDLDVQCLEDGINVTIRLEKSFSGMMFVKGHSDTEGCFKDIAASDGTEESDEQYVNFYIDSEKCGINTIISKELNGVNMSTVINVIHHKLVETESDRGYLIQCFIANSDDAHNLSAELDVKGSIGIGETVELGTIPPLCKYSLRSDAPDGPVIPTAEIGQIIYHRWECEGVNASKIYGMHVHDCFAGSNDSHEILTVDSKGCSPNKEFLEDISYSEEVLVATAQSKVFKIPDIQHIIFHCKVSLCTKENNGCQDILPPNCSSGIKSDNVQHRRTRNFESVANQALTSNVHADIGISPEPLVQPEAALRLKHSIHKYGQLSSIWLLVAMVVMSTFGIVAFLKLTRSKKAAEFTDTGDENNETVSVAVSSDLISVNGTYSKKNVSDEFISGGSGITLDGKQNQGSAIDTADDLSTSTINLKNAHSSRKNRSPEYITSDDNCILTIELKTNKS